MAVAVMVLLSLNGQDVALEKVRVCYGDTLKYDLGRPGDEDRIKIIAQPRYNALEGFCNREPLTYCYTPIITSGVDSIEFSIQTGSDGSSSPTHKETRKVIIEIYKN